MAKYESLKDYLRLNYKTHIFQGINEYIKHKGVDYKLDDIIIETVSSVILLPGDFQDLDDGYNIDIFNITIGISGIGQNAEKNNVELHYYNMILTGILKNKSNNIHIPYLNEVHKEELAKETVLSLFGLNNINMDNIEKTAEKIHSRLFKYININNKHKYWFSVIEVKNKNGMKMWPADLPDNILGQIYFKKSVADIYNPDNMAQPHKNYEIPANTILLNIKYYRNEFKCYDDIITATHELIHFDQHDVYFKILQLIDDECKTMECSVESLVLDKKIA